MSDDDSGDWGQGMLNRIRTQRDLHLDRMFETRSEAWEAVGLSVNTNMRVVRRARRDAVILLPLMIAVRVAYGNRSKLLTKSQLHQFNTLIQIATVLLLLALGWGVARAFGRAAGPTIFRRMDPATAGTVGFLIRFATIAITLLIALRVASVQATTIVAGSAFTAIVLGLAAQQTLGNLFAGMVLLTARPFRVGELVRLQAGAVGGSVEGVVRSLGLLYITLARGEDNIMIPNNVVLAAAVVPIREPDPVDVKVRLGSGVRLSQVQALLDDQIATPTRSSASVVLEELDGDDVVVRVKATPERANDGAKLADEVIATLASVTGEHELVDRPTSRG
ncbi:MAG: mechanosensitive ion channel family protein [Solirubrobacteraceae bacterium]|jgi:small conductance mechanosensitive channel